MWYFTWVLGLGTALAFGVLNGIWYEFGLPDEEAIPSRRADPAISHPD